ncbi:MAG: hypothetical protein JXJ04_25955 [Spirochaetales bacterium]|nr:hypothetical protein [Spirochaetales bacterium]
MFSIILKLTEGLKTEELTEFIQKLKLPDEYWKEMLNENIMHASRIPLMSAVLKAVDHFSLAELKEIVIKIKIDNTYAKEYELFFRHLEEKIAAPGSKASLLRELITKIISAQSAVKTGDLPTEGTWDHNSHNVTDAAMTAEQGLALEREVSALGPNRRGYPLEIEGTPEPDSGLYMTASTQAPGHAAVILALFQSWYGGSAVRPPESGI